MLLRFVIIRLLIVIYSVRTRSVTVVFAVLPFAVVLPVSAVTVAVSVSVPVSFAVFIFVAGVAVRFFSVERFAVPFVAGVGSGFFRQVFLVAVSVAFLFLLFQGSIETGNTVLPQDILRIAFGRLRLGIGFERDRLHAFLVHVDHIEGAVGWDCNQVGRERFIGRVVCAAKLQRKSELTKEKIK